LRFSLPDTKRREKTPRQDTAKRLQRLPPQQRTRQDASRVIEQIGHSVLFNPPTKQTTRRNARPQDYRLTELACEVNVNKAVIRMVSDNS